MLIDSNIIIYVSQQQYGSLANFLANLPNRSASIVSYIETLGYHQLNESERVFLEEFYVTTDIPPYPNPSPSKPSHCAGSDGWDWVMR